MKIITTKKYEKMRKIIIDSILRRLDSDNENDALLSRNINQSKKIDEISKVNSELAEDCVAFLDTICNLKNDLEYQNYLMTIHLEEQKLNILNQLQTK